MKTSKVILVAFVLLGAFYCQQAQGSGRLGADSTKTKAKTEAKAETKTIQLKLNSAEDLQNLLKMFGGQANVKGKDSTGKSGNLDAATIEKFMQMLGLKGQVTTNAQDSTHKTVRLNVKSAQDIQKLMQMIGGQMKVNGQGDTVKKTMTVKKGTMVKTKQDSINGRPAWWGKSVLNQKAPEMVVSRWITEEPKTKGKFVMLHHWGLTCGPCLLSIPTLNEWSKTFKKDLVVIGLARDDSKDKDKGIEYYRGVDGGTFVPLDIRILSYVLLIDPQGIVRWEGVRHDLTTEKLQEIMTKYK